jgi:hypothetical protein
MQQFFAVEDDRMTFVSPQVVLGVNRALVTEQLVHLRNNGIQLVAKGERNSGSLRL